MAGLNRRERLVEIEAQASELENSPYNTATVSKQNQDYYANVLADYARAEREREYGFSPEQRAEANQGFAESNNLAMQNAQNAGGGSLQKYINAALNNNANKFQTGMAAQDAALQMQKQQQVLNYLNTLGQAANVYQDVATQNFQKNTLAEQAIGQAEKDWYAQKDARNNELLKAGVNIVGAIGAVASDIRLKENIVYSHQENGYKVYEFNYKGNPKERFSGVMAQEVVKLNPDAVIEEDGFLKVNYEKLGITMKKIN